jgi:hypothetical protein
LFIVANPPFCVMARTEPRKMPRQSQKCSAIADPPELKKAGTQAGARRSRRVRHEMRIAVYLPQKNKEPIRVVGKSLVVNAHGALLTLGTQVAVGQEVRLLNPRTKETIDCQVKRVTVSDAGKQYVGVEFVAVSPSFWNIESPPLDWDPAHARTEAATTADAAALEIARKIAFSQQSQANSAETVDSEDAQEANRHQTRRTMITALVGGAALLSVWGATTLFTGSRGQNVARTSASTRAIPLADGRLIPELASTRLATPKDFEASAVTWLRGLGQEPAGRVYGNYAGSGSSAAYVLVEKDNARRVAIIANGRLVYDAEYPRIAILARVPKEALAGIQWADASVPVGDGDGLLLVRSFDAPASGVILLLQGSQTMTGSPINYRQINLGRAH